jgi:hypothetical protein
MLNTILVEGIVTKGCWRYGGAEFIRLACYPDPDRSRGNDASQASFITIRCEGPLALLAANLKEGDRIQVQGTLCSRSYDIPLQTYARKAQGPSTSLAALRQQAEKWADISMRHVINEVYAERLIIVNRSRRGHGKGNSPAAAGVSQAP